MFRNLILGLALSAMLAVPAVAMTPKPTVTTGAAVVTEREYATLKAETIDMIDAARVGQSKEVLYNTASPRTEANVAVNAAKDAQTKGNRAVFDTQAKIARDMTARACDLLPGC